ncbi:MAG: RNA methyltransferase [Defluviitaleaceae bacterium]|nr:RNA methyltransferase [Defluviitaleaceae bacterium]
MNFKKIGKENFVVKKIKAIRLGKENNSFVIEGSRILDITHEVDIEYIVFCESVTKNENFLSEYSKLKNLENLYLVKENIFKAITKTVTPQGVLAVCKKNIYNLEDLEISKNVFILILHEINDPGNMGTILRCALSFGVDFVLVSKNSVNIYNDKVLRSSAGAIFDLKIVENINTKEIIEYLTRNNIDIVATTPYANDYHYNVNFKNSVGIVMGNEANGIPQDVMDICATKIKIPIIKMESLNVSIACGIILHEVIKQRIT